MGYSSVGKHSWFQSSVLQNKQNMAWQKSASLAGAFTPRNVPGIMKAASPVPQQVNLGGGWVASDYHSPFHK